MEKITKIIHSSFSFETVMGSMSVNDLVKSFIWYSTMKVINSFSWLLSVSKRGESAVYFNNNSVAGLRTYNERENSQMPGLCHHHIAQFISWQFDGFKKEEISLAV